jgi:hypothetical protein
MMSFELSENEAGVLLEVLEHDLSDLRMEIAGTDRLDYRNMLREKKWVIRDVIARLHTETHAVAMALPRELHPEI